ncbi:hypothetical protein [Hyphomicrobium sp.]
MTGSLMAASQPVAKHGVAGHQAEAAETEGDVDKIEHWLRSW